MNDKLRNTIINYLRKKYKGLDVKLSDEYPYCWLGGGTLQIKGNNNRKLWFSYRISGGGTLQIKNK